MVISPFSHPFFFLLLDKDLACEEIYSLVPDDKKELLTISDGTKDNERAGIVKYCDLYAGTLNIKTKSDGTYPKAKWKKIEGSWYCFTKNGYMKTGWQKSGESWYLLKSSGAMAHNEWVKQKGAWYFLKSDGKMAENETISWKGKTYHIDGTGGVADNRRSKAFSSIGFPNR